MTVWIKELKELNACIELVLIQGLEIAADKKVNASDLTHVVELIKGYTVLSTGIEGIKEIPEEIKDLDQVELIQLVGEYYAMVSRICKAYEDAKPV